MGDEAAGRAATAALVVGALYFAQVVLIPIALASLVTFLLSPVVNALDRRIGRVPAVLAVTALALVLTAGVGWLLARQLSTLATELPQYRANIRQRVQDIRGFGSAARSRRYSRPSRRSSGKSRKAMPPNGRAKPAPAVVEPQSSLLFNFPGLFDTAAMASVVAVP